MNRTHLFLGIIALGLIAALIVVVLTGVFSAQKKPAPLTTTQGSTVAPTGFKAAVTVDKAPVATCYAWYIQALIDDLQRTNPEGYASQLRTCFTDYFISSWSATSESAGVDPVLYAQDFDPSWATHVQTEKINDDTLLVTLGTDASIQRLRVRYTVEGGVTRITSVAPYTTQ